MVNNIAPYSPSILINNLHPKTLILIMKAPLSLWTHVCRSGFKRGRGPANARTHAQNERVGSWLYVSISGFFSGFSAL